MAQPAVGPKPDPWHSDPFADLPKRLLLGAWQADLVTRGRRLRFLLLLKQAHQPPAPDLDEAAEALQTHLRGVGDALGRKAKLSGFREIMFGKQVDAATSHIQEAEALVAQYLSDEEIIAELPRVLSQAEKVFPPDDWRRTVAEDNFLPLPKTCLTPLQRSVYVQTLRSVNDVATQQLTRVRSFRNQLLCWALALALLAAGLALLGRLHPAAISLCFTPNDKPVCPTGQDHASGGDISVILVLGLMGAALSVAFGLRGARQTSAPFGVASALLLLKIPCGALTALAGILLIRGGFVPGFSNLDTTEQIIAYALLFGFAQQLLTRVVDDKGAEIIDKVANSEPPPADEQPKPKRRPPIKRSTT